MDRRFLLGALLFTSSCAQAAPRTASACPAPKSGLKYEMYRDPRNDWRWRLVASNGNIIANSGEGYKNKSACEDGIRSVQASYMTDVIEIDQ